MLRPEKMIDVQGLEILYTTQRSEGRGTRSKESTKLQETSFRREVLCSFSYVRVQTYEANLSLGGQMIGFDFSYILWTLVKHTATLSNDMKFEECYMFLATIQLFIKGMSCTQNLQHAWINLNHEVKQ